MKFSLYKSVLAVILAIAIFQLVAIASPFEKEKCNLGWEHVKHKHNEATYQQAWCKAHNGIEEYENEDFTRVDCLTETHAVEFDFANKWAESVGQALHYGLMTGKKPKVVLILDNPQAQIVYFKRVQKLARKYKFDAEFVTNDILTVDAKGRCQNPKCKCYKCKE